MDRVTHTINDRINYRGPNHPVIVWGACFLWVTSMFAIAWSLALFYCVGDVLVILKLDLMNSIVLLCGIIMMPTNVHILYLISQGELIDHSSKVICCPLWLCMFCIIIINLVGAVLCGMRIRTCWSKITGILARSLLQYRSAPKYKHFMDSVQWNLRCCGLNSYKDWFSRDWYDKIRDYEWDPNNENFNKLNHYSKKESTISDSVPLSCCKSGSCIANYLTEMGTSFINVRGCGTHVHRIVLVTLAGHLFVFVSVILVETILLILIKKQAKRTGRFENTRTSRGGEYNVKHIMTVRDNFDVSSGSVQLYSDESDDEAESLRQYEERMHK